jgi:hypothetical protein
MAKLIIISLGSIMAVMIPFGIIAVTAALIVNAMVIYND